MITRLVPSMDVVGGPEDLLHAHGFSRALEIRDAVPADVPAMERVYATAEDTHVGRAVRKLFEFHTEKPWDRLGSFRVSTNAGQVVGFASTRTPAGQLDTTTGLVDALYVHRAFPRMGIGRRLLSDAENVLREKGARSALVSTGPERKLAHAFYQAMGWTKLETSAAALEQFMRTGEEHHVHPLWRGGITSQAVFTKNL